MIRFRRIRFGIRSLLIGASIVCVALGWRAYCWNQDEKAIAAIRAIGGQVEFGLAHVAFRSWLLGRSGVAGVHFFGPTISDANIDEITHHASKLSGLKRISFVETVVSRAGEQAIQRELPHVEIELVATAMGVPYPVRLRLHRTTGLTELRKSGVYGERSPSR